MEPDFAIDSSVEGRLALSGELDVLGATMLATELAARDGVALLIDLSRVTFIDSSGLKGLLRAKRDHPVRIVHPAPTVSRLLEVTGLRDVLVDDVLLDDAPSDPPLEDPPTG